MGRPAETSLGGGDRAFPATRWSILREAKDPSSPERIRALDEFCRLYWKPVYGYLRAARPFGNEEAKDLTQEFLLQMLEGELISRYSAERGNFRTYLKGALKLFILKRHRDATTEKRGGGRTAVPIDDREAARIDRVLSAGADPEEIFDRQWSNAVLDQSVAELRDRLSEAGRETVFLVFDRHDLNPPPEGEPSYAELAREFRIKETDVTNHLSTCRRMLKERVTENLRELVGDEAAVREELARLFGG